MIKTVEITWKILRLTSDVQLSSSTNNSASSAHKFDLDTSDFGLILPFRDNFSSLMLSSSNLSLSIDLSFDKALAETHRNLLAVVVSPPISGENSDEFNFFCFVSKADFCSAMASEHGGHFHSICKNIISKIQSQLCKSIRPKELLTKRHLRLKECLILAQATCMIPIVARVASNHEFTGISLIVGTSWKT